ncbi:hypothetical protein Aduo_008383 [Ancylostoma duodenale]
MSATKPSIRERLLHEYQLGHSAAVGRRNVCAALGQDVLKKHGRILLQEVPWRKYGGERWPTSRPGAAPSDYHLFKSIQHYLEGKQLMNVEEVKDSLTRFF